MRILVVVPTYNERENILDFIQAVHSEVELAHILVVDDSSPDGTGELADKASRKYEFVHVMHRDRKEGLGRAYVAGFKWGIERGYGWIVEMDADFSHRPEDLKRIVSHFGGNEDFIVGSRWVSGGEVENWGPLRRLMSFVGSLYSRTILGFPLRDWTGGFNAWRASIFKTVHLDSITSNGYSFQIEMKYQALRSGFKGLEVPIKFANRERGQSKMSLRILLEAFIKVWSIRRAS